MCDALNYNEPRMRFEFFLDGLRNKQMRAMLNSSMVTSIPEACALLLYKNLHLPVEEDGEFVSDGTSRAESKEASSTQSQMLLQLQQLNQRLMQPQNAGSTRWRRLWRLCSSQVGTLERSVGLCRFASLPTPALRKVEWCVVAVCARVMVVSSVLGGTVCATVVATKGTT